MKFKLVLICLLITFASLSFADSKLSRRLPVAQEAIPLLPEFRRKQVLENLAIDSSAYDKHVELVKPYVLGNGKIYDGRTLFPGITV